MNAKVAVQLFGEAIIGRPFFAYVPRHHPAGFVESVDRVVVEIHTIYPEPDRNGVVAITEDVEDGVEVMIEEADSIEAAIRGDGGWVK